MQPDFSTLKPVASSQPDFATLKPAAPAQDAKPQSVWQQLAGGVNKVAQGVSNFVGAEGITNQFGADIARATAPQDQKNLVEYPSMKSVVGSAIQTGANLIPGIGSEASLLAKVGTGAATGYAFDVGGKLQNNETVKQSIVPGAGTIIAGALPILGKITGIAGAAENLKGASNKLEELNLRLTPVDKQNLAKKGQGIVNFLADKKIVGTPETRYLKINNIYNEMEKTVQTVIKDSKQVYSKTDVLESIKNIPESFVDDPAGYDEAVGATNKILKFIQEKAPDKIDATLLNKYKRNMFDRAYSKNNVDVVNETYHAIGSAFKATLDSTIKPLAKLSDEYGKIITAKKILYKAQSRSQLGIVGKAVGTGASAALGGLVGGPVGAAAGTVAGPVVGQLLAGTATRSAVGAGARNLSDLITKLPTDVAGNISKKTLLDLINSFSNGN